MNFLRTAQLNLLRAIVRYLSRFITKPKPEIPPLIVTDEDRELAEAMEHHIVGTMPEGWSVEEVAAAIAFARQSIGRGVLVSSLTRGNHVFIRGTEGTFLGIDEYPGVLRSRLVDEAEQAPLDPIDPIDAMEAIRRGYIASSGRHLHMELPRSIRSTPSELAEISAATGYIDAIARSLPERTSIIFRDFASTPPGQVPSPQVPDICIACRNLHGIEYGGNRLVCGIHPKGNGENCSDFEPLTSSFGNQES